MQNFLSITELASKLGVDPTSVARWELSESEPSIENKAKLMDWFASFEV
ncbi:MAG: helix-turn-helix transcriptional regulator [Desulfobacter sp.]|nr:MAG: helix-turn-helix transcriptional regulator [Desulfobacter sp.]